MKRRWAYSVAGGAALIFSSLAAFAELTPAVETLTCASGRCQVDLNGANVFSYVPAGARDVLFRPSGGGYRPGQWQNRGIPLSWPWFDLEGVSTNLPMHGFARSFRWRILEKRETRERSRLVLGLESSSESLRLWPHPFALRYEIELGEGLSLRLTTKNTGAKSMRVMAGFHPYFAISDIDAISLEGLGATNACVYPGFHRFLPSSGFAAELSDAGWNRRLALRARGTSHCVLWNVGRHWKHFPDLRENDVDNYFCVEAQIATTTSAVEILPGSSHTVSYEIRPSGGLVEPEESDIEDPFGDPDGDGLINLHERWAGCDPHVPDGSNTVLSVMARSIDSRLRSGDAKGRLLKFDAKGYGRTLNTNCWAYGIDTTSASHANSRRGSFMGGAAVSPRHFVMAAHYAFNPGDKVRFFGCDHVEVTRTVIATNRLGRTDVFVCLLDSDLPATVRPARLLPRNYREYIHNGRGLPALMFDFNEKAGVSEIAALPIAGGLADGRVPTAPRRLAHFEPVEMGDSGDPKYLVLGDEAILVCCLYTWGKGKSGAGPFLTAMADELQRAMDSLSDAHGAPRHSLSFVDLRNYDGLKRK